MKIGQLAKAIGLSPKTIRFYEAEGLVRDPERTLSGYRSYGPEDVIRLEFIRKFRRLGLSRAEVKSILQLHDRKEPTCVHVRSLLDEKLARVEAALQDLQGFQKELQQLRDGAGTLTDCVPTGGRICGIIEQAAVEASDGALAWIIHRSSSP
ncbi:MAG: heavy metal-responsive transcriptional regulator [Chloroflexi bacterium]|nr:heavy metal-responsive transcriptional regulator [Chloroflexota bacterium]